MYYVEASHIRAPTTGHSSVKGYVIHAHTCDISRSPPRVHVPLIDLASDANQSVKGNICVSIDDYATFNGPSSPILGTPPTFLNPL